MSSYKAGRQAAFQKYAGSGLGALGGSVLGGGLGSMVGHPFLGAGLGAAGGAVAGNGLSDESPTPGGSALGAGVGGAMGAAGGGLAGGAAGAAAGFGLGGMGGKDFTKHLRQHPTLLKDMHSIGIPPELLKGKGLGANIGGLAGGALGLLGGGMLGGTGGAVIGARKGHQVSEKKQTQKTDAADKDLKKDVAKDGE